MIKIDPKQIPDFDMTALARDIIAAVEGRTDGAEDLHLGRGRQVPTSRQRQPDGAR